MTGQELAWLRRDHADLLHIIDRLAPGTIHKDARCERMPPPHVLGPDCWPQPDNPSEEAP